VRKIIASSAVACGLITAAISLASESSAVCDAADCVPNVARNVVAGAPCAPRASFVFGFDAESRTLICASQGTWVSVGPLVGEREVTQRCNDCDSRGTLKDKAPCPSCDGSAIGIGWMRCEACRADGRKAVATVASVFETESCAGCGGKGWPLEGKAVACAKCLGLGARIKPASEPQRTLD
jgi:hypothetical protein